MKINYNIKEFPDNRVTHYLKQIKDPVLRNKALVYHEDFCRDIGKGLRDDLNTYLFDISNDPNATYASRINSISTALLYGFDFSQTSEGDSYWFDITGKDEDTL